MRSVSKGRSIWTNQNPREYVRACSVYRSRCFFKKKSGFLITETRRKQHCTLILRLKLTVSTYRMNEINFASSFMDAMNALCYVPKNFTFNVIYILLTCHWLVSRMRVVIEAWNVLHVHYTRSLLLFRLRENRSTGNTNWHRTFFSKWEIISFLGQESETFIRISRGFETQNKRGLKMVAFFSSESEANSIQVLSEPKVGMAINI